MSEQPTRHWPSWYLLPDGGFALSRVSTDDYELLTAWMNDPEVAEFWELDGPPERTLAYLTEQRRSTHAAAYIGTLDGTPMSYWELYWADLDPLAAHYDAKPYDGGIHLLLGPGEFRGRGLGARLLRDVADVVFLRGDEVRRVVAEPDVRNVRSIAAFERAGFVRAADLELPTKRAALMIKTREPHD